MKPRVGCAGWAIAKQNAAFFPTEGSHLARYSKQFESVEVNSCFYRSHRHSTYASWSAQTPASFAFSLKVPKEITHHRRLINCDEALIRFLDETAALGPKRGPLLVQLPPSLPYDAKIVGDFFRGLRQLYGGETACEPRHPSWFAPEPERLLTSFEIARVAADPSLVPCAAEPGGWSGLAYFRLHGSPQMYYSKYPAERLASVAAALTRAAARANVWCMFDNTALGAATGDALAVIEQIERPE